MIMALILISCSLGGLLCVNLSQMKLLDLLVNTIILFANLVITNNFYSFASGAAFGLRELGLTS